MKEYELTVVLDTTKDVEERTKKIDAILNKYGVKIVKKENDGKKRLAYRIREQEFGFYTFYELELDEKHHGAITRELNFEDAVLRYLFIPVDTGRRG